MTVKILNINSGERGLFARESFNKGDIVTMLEVIPFLLLLELLYKLDKTNIWKVGKVVI
jgi:hypothetical protein